MKDKLLNNLPTKIEKIGRPELISKKFKEAFE